MRNPIRLVCLAGLLLTALTGSALAQTVLRPGDKVMITISGVPLDEQAQISREYTIDEKGSVNLPFLTSTISAAGRSPSELENAIESAYKGNEIYVSPTITVGSQQGARFVDVSGQVKAPQRVPFTEDLTLMSAISACGGTTPYANERKIQLMRDGKPSVLDLKKIRKDPRGDIQLKPGDKIIIDESWL